MALLASAWYVVRDWHYKPIHLLERQLITVKLDNKAKDITINNLGVQIVQLTENNKVLGFEEYFKGVADANISVVSDKLIF